LKNATNQTPRSHAESNTAREVALLGNAEGKFITLEGLDGCGKTTQTNLLAEMLRSHAIDVTVTREPGGSALGEAIRGLLLDSATRNLSPRAELAMMFAARAQHIQEVILPALKAGRWVLCDRFTDSSEAYQGGGRELGTDMAMQLHRTICGGLHPEMTILLDADISISLSRARSRADSNPASGTRDEARFEKESQEFFTRVRSSYLAIARREPDRVVLIDAKRPVEAIHDDIAVAVKKRFFTVPRAAAA